MLIKKYKTPKTVSNSGPGGKDKTLKLGWPGSRHKIWRLLKLSVNMYALLYLKWKTNKALLHIAQGTLLSFIWPPGWEGSFEDSRYLYMHEWAPLLCTCNHQNIVILQYKIKSLKNKSRKLQKNVKAVKKTSEIFTTLCNRIGKSLRWIIF